jgi:hypothetical protein
MTKIKCPHCQKPFSLDNDERSNIIKQIRDEEFEKELETRLKLANAEKNNAVLLVKSEAQKETQRLIAEQEKAIQALQTQIENNDTVQKLAIKEAVSTMEKDLLLINGEFDRSKLSSELDKKGLINQHQIELLDRDDTIERLRDMKTAMSTKMIGETLELHCENSFNLLRSSAFPMAYFEKDNEIVGGTKGDYVFRDRDVSGTEIVSIMFEMKNEMDATASKKKNEDFLKTLDKNRIAKGCEYAILVTMLESDSDLYNTGIVDVSHRYPKMLVVRPQFFVPIISLLRSTSMKSLEYKRELDLIKTQSIDVTNFEENLNTFKDGFARNYDLASKQFGKAIDEIDKSIDHLKKTKDSLLSADRNLRLANDKSQAVSIKKLTKNNPTMSKEFSALGNHAE